MRNGRMGRKIVALGPEYMGPRLLLFAHFCFLRDSEARTGCFDWESEHACPHTQASAKLF